MLWDSWSNYPRFVGHQTCSLTISNEKINQMTRQVSSFHLEVGIFQNQGKPLNALEMQALMWKTHFWAVSKHLLLKHIHIIFNMVDYLESNLKTDTILWWALEKGTCFFYTWLTIFGYVSKLCAPPKKNQKLSYTKTHTTKRSCFCWGLSHPKYS